MRVFWDSILRLGPFCWKSLIILFVLFLFFPRSYRYPQIFVDQQNVCNMQDDVEAIIGDTVSSSSFGGSSISLPSRRRRSKARFGDKNLIKWMSYHKFWGYIFDYFILVPGRIICKCVCMYVYINFFGFAMAFAKSWFHHHHRSLRPRHIRPSRCPPNPPCGVPPPWLQCSSSIPPCLSRFRQSFSTWSLVSLSPFSGFDLLVWSDFFSLYHTETKKKFISIKTTKKIVVN